MEVAVPPLVSARLVWPREAVIPGVDETPRVTVPAKLLRLVRVNVDVTDEGLTRIVWENGFAVAEKSETFTVIVAVCVNVPFVALTVTV